MLRNTPSKYAIQNKKSKLIDYFDLPRSTLDRWQVERPLQVHCLDLAAQAITMNPDLIRLLDQQQTSIQDALDALGIERSPYTLAEDIFPAATVRGWEKRKWKLFVAVLLSWHQEQRNELTICLSLPDITKIEALIGAASMVKLYTTDKHAFVALSRHLFVDTPT